MRRPRYTSEFYGPAGTGEVNVKVTLCQEDAVFFRTGSLLLRDCQEALAAFEEIGEQNLVRFLGENWGIEQLLKSMREHIAVAQGGEA